MRGLNKVLAGTAAVGLAATLAACGSDSSSDSGASKEPVGAFKTLTGQTTTVNLDPGFVQALGTLKVTPGVLGTAKANLTSSPATLTFPITGGNATIYNKGAVTPYVQGQIDHNGSGFSLSAGGTTVQLENFVVDPGNNSKLTGKVSANGKLVKDGVKLFDLDGSTLKTPTISGGVATLDGTTIYLSTDAADLLNQTFKVDALKGGVGTGTKIGTATIKATGS